MDPSILLGAVEAGGTKFVCGVGNALCGSRETKVLQTNDPVATFAGVNAFFRDVARRYGRIAALGIASFGPLELDSRSQEYGWITSTPKAGWANTDILGALAGSLNIPGAIDTDVNAAALAEADTAGRGGMDSLIYVTVGTGVGVGIVVNGGTVHGHGHPEMGHIIVRRHSEHGDFSGICPYHGDCLEGLASGPAIKSAWGASLADLPAHHKAWEIEADYIAQLCSVLILTLAPQRIVLGGGVMSQPRLLPAIHRRTAHWLAGYLSAYDRPEYLSRCIVPPSCREPPGLIGAYLLAERVCAQRR